MKPLLRNILLGGLTLALGKTIYEKGKQDQRKEFRNGINQVLADQKIKEISKEIKDGEKAKKKVAKAQSKES